VVEEKRRVSGSILVEGIEERRSQSSPIVRSLSSASRRKVELVVVFVSGRLRRASGKLHGEFARL
jgi:hypothetical protein